MPSLLGLKAQALRHALSKTPVGTTIFLLMLGLLLVWAEVYGTWRALRFLEQFGSLGLGVFARVLELGLITLSSGVTFSATTTAIQTLYLSDDLHFLLTQPLATGRVFALKVFETFLTAALVPLGLILPLLLTVAVFLQAPLWAYAVIGLAALCTFAAPVGLGALLAVLLMRLAPVGRVREVSTALGVLISAGLVYVIRALRPEVLVQRAQDPAAFQDLLRQLGQSSTPLLPPAWAAQGIWQAAQGTLSLSLWPLLWLTTSLLLAGTWLAAHAYQAGWARALDSSLPKLKQGVPKVSWLEHRLGRWGLGGTLAFKDLRLMQRDPTHWSQLLVVLALAGVYLVSVKAVSVPIPQFKGIVGYGQLAFQGFIVGGVATRLAFPAVSLEGRSYWLLRTAPLSARQVVLSKFWGVLPITLALGLTLGIVSARTLDLGPTLTLLCVLVSLSNVFVITALGIGLGAMAPKFDADNPAEIGVSPAGLSYMGLSLAYSVLCLLLLARPVAASILQPELFPGYSALWTWEGLLGLGALLLITWLGTWLSLRTGWERLERWE